jgi:hypothetical protein
MSARSAEIFNGQPIGVEAHTSDTCGGVKVPVELRSAGRYTDNRSTANATQIELVVMVKNDILRAIQRHFAGGTERAWLPRLGRSNCGAFWRIANHECRRLSHSVGSREVPVKDVENLHYVGKISLAKNTPSHLESHEKRHTGITRGSARH